MIFYCSREECGEKGREREKERKRVGKHEKIGSEKESNDKILALKLCVQFAYFALQGFLRAWQNFKIKNQ